MSKFLFKSYLFLKNNSLWLYIHYCTHVHSKCTEITHSSHLWIVQSGCNLTQREACNNAMQPFTIVYQLSGIKATVDEDGKHFFENSKWVSISFITSQLLSRIHTIWKLIHRPILNPTSTGKQNNLQFLSFLLEYS